MVNEWPFKSRTMARAARTALGSPSMANGTWASEAREPRTNVIKGCTDATAAPRFRSAVSSSLVRAPLEWSATLPLQSAALDRDAAAPAMAPSGTQNQIIGARICDRRTATTDAPTSRANRRARRREAARPRAITCSIPYPAAVSDTARALARFPAPTMAMRGFAFAGMPGRIAESASNPALLRPGQNPEEQWRALYCWNAQVFALQIEAG